eukprot:GHVP01040840.1.p1 GENE.GHVP01040840.1~~GHVP01040840.1.p1  ORF type:complete len:191 (-),score=32.86 GHVP01040840.1:19-546(-)
MRAERMIDERLSKYPILLYLEQKTGLKKSQSIIVIFLLFVAFLMLVIIPKIFVDAFGFCIPAYMSMKMIKELNETGTINKEEVTKWTTYWIVFTLLLLSERILFILRYIPFYHAVRLGFIIWMILPQSNGALMLHSNRVSQIFSSIEQNIEEYIKNKADSLLDSNFAEGGQKKDL